MLSHTHSVNQAFGKPPDTHKFPGWCSLALSHERGKIVKENLICPPLHTRSLWMPHKHCWIQQYFLEERWVIKKIDYAYFSTGTWRHGKIRDLPTVTQEIVNRNRFWLRFPCGLIRCLTVLTAFFLSYLFSAHIQFTNLPQNVTNAFEVSFHRCNSSYASPWRGGTIVLPLITAIVFKSIFKWKQLKGIKRINQASLIPYKASVTPHI